MNFIRKNNNIIFIFVLCVIFSIYNVNKLTKEESYNEINVFEGDTLWALAEQYNNDEIPLNSWIHQVMTMNDLSSTTIIAGEKLRIPINKSSNKENSLNELAKAGK